VGTDIHAVAEVFRNDAWHLSDAVIPDDRNYVSFAILADVRNGYGFGGFDSGDRVKPISEPRGLPEDLSAELRARLEGDSPYSIWLGEHSFSWLTLAELQAYDLDAPCIRRGMVPPDEAARIRLEGGPPHISANWVADSSWEKMTWTIPLKNEASLLTCIIEALLLLGSPNRVRLVFGFDN